MAMTNINGGIMSKRVKILTILCSALLLLTCSPKPGNVPVSGEAFKITYEGIELTGEVKLVYTYDYWGTTYSGYAGPDKLFENVLNPDSGKATTVDMKKVGKIWQATIDIPKDVVLLSYYFSDGKNYDHNDKKTYVSYIYNQKGIPVKNAHFRNVDFLLMANESPERVTEEVKAEISDYPKNWVAQIVYWRKIFENAKTIDELNRQLENANKKYNKLVKTFGESDSLKQVKAGYLYDFGRNVYRPVQSLARNSFDEFKKIMATVPFENQYGSMKLNYARFLQSEKRSQENEKFMSKLKGTIAPDFNFETVEGKIGKLSDFRGNYALLEFWATGCGSSISELKNLKKAYDDYSGKGFEILSVCCDNMPQKEFLKFVEEKEITWHQVLEGNDKTISDLYKVHYYPTFILIDPDGKVINLDGEIRGERLSQKLKELYQSKI